VPPFLGWGSGSAAQPTWNHPHKKKDMEIWYFPRISMGRTSWAKNVSFWEGIYHPSLLGVGDFSNSTGMASQRHLGCWDVAIPKVSRDAFNRNNREHRNGTPK